MTVDTQHRVDVKLSRFVAGYSLVQALNVTIKSILPIPVELHSAISAGFMGVLGIWLAFTIPAALRRAFAPFVVLECTWLCLYLISYLMGYADRHLLARKALWTMLVCVPIAIYVYSVKDKLILYKTLLASSYVIAAIISLIPFFPPESSQYSNMSFSYALLLPTLLHINEWFSTYKKRYFLIASAEVLAIILYGARGPLISIGVMLGLKLLLSAQKKAELAVVGVGSVLLTLFISCFDQIGATALSFLEQHGYYSRTISVLFSGRLAESPDRLALYQYYFELAVQKPLTGWGIGGGWIRPGLGPHNMLLEFLLAFGFLFGGVACLTAIALWLRLFTVEDGPHRHLLTVFASSSSVLYTVSGDVLENAHFFVFVALCLAGSEVRMKNRGQRRVLRGNG